MLASRLLRPRHVHTLFFAAPMLLVAACNGQVQEGPDADHDAGSHAMCVDAACADREDTQLEGGSFDAANDLCGMQMNGGDGFVIWLDTAGSCRCERDAQNRLHDCEVTLPDECTSQTSCEACNANRACAFCPGQGCLPRPAFACEADLGRCE